MIDSSINVLLMSVFKSFRLGPLRSTGIVIQLANRSQAYLVSVIEDTLIGVKELIFLVDFYVLDMEAKSSSSRALIILGRAFLMTAKTVINVHAGTLTMEFGEQVVRFSIFDIVRQLVEGHSIM